LREHLCFEHAGALRRETPRAGCALIKRPHLSAVSFLKSVAGFLAGTVIAVQPFASSEEAELWGPANDLSSEPTGAKHGALSRLSRDAFRFNDLRRVSPSFRRQPDSPPALPFLPNPIQPGSRLLAVCSESICRSAIPRRDSLHDDHSRERSRCGRLAGARQRCLKRGARFSTKAVMPSFWSSVANSE